MVGWLVGWDTTTTTTTVPGWTPREARGWMDTTWASWILMIIICGLGWRDGKEDAGPGRAAVSMGGAWWWWLWWMDGYLPRYWIERVSVPMNNTRPLFSHLLVLCCLLVKPSREEGWGSTSGHVVSLHLPPSHSLGARELRLTGQALTSQDEPYTDSQNK